MGAEVSFRSATAGDVPTLALHRRLIFEDMRVAQSFPFQDSDLKQMEEEYEEYLRGQMSQGVLQAWVAQTGAGIVASGCVSILPWPPAPIWPAAAIGLLHSMYTVPEYRKRGIGRSIIDALAAACRGKGCRQLIIGGTGTNAGRHLYETIGFRPAPNSRLNL